MTNNPAVATVEIDRPSFVAEEILQRAESRLAEALSQPPGGLPWTWTPLTNGGSDRNFYRLEHPDGNHCIVMHYSVEREENALYPDIARFLRANHLNAPQLIFHDDDLRLIALEDLGDESLHAVSFRQPGSDPLRALYEAALEQARLLHRHASAPVRMMNGFDAALYRWERHYFLDHLVGRRAGLRLTETRRAEIEDEGERMAAELLSLPRCLIHRDFQSQNLFVHKEAVWLIDFQGMRPGHAVYDVASLLYDPYVKMDPAWRSSLLDGYSQGRNMERSFYQAAVQRLMQALGAYAYLGLVRDKPHFLKHIPAGLANLADALQRMGGMSQTLDVVRQIQVEMRPETVEVPR